VLAAVVVNLHAYDAESDTEMLVALHLPSRCGSPSRSRTWAGRSGRTSGAWTSSASPASVHLLRVDRARGRCAHGSDRGDPRAGGSRRRAGGRAGAAVGSGGRGGRGRLARGVEAARHREHGSGAHDAMHPALRGDARLRRSRLCRDRARRRIRSRAPQRHRRPAGRLAVGAGRVPESAPEALAVAASPRSSLGASPCIST
jgi:hypothetical protein